MFSCHGKVAGQNGFRLSLRGYAPEMDYKSLTRELGGRRVSLGSPEDSLLLRKPLGLAAHEGGKLMLRIVILLLGVPAIVGGAILADRALSLSLIEVFVAVTFIIGFAVAAAGWTIRRDV